MNEPHAIKLKKLFVKTSGDFLMKRQTIARRYAPRDCHNAGSQDHVSVRFISRQFLFQCQPVNAQYFDDGGSTPGRLAVKC